MHIISNFTKYLTLLLAIRFLLNYMILFYFSIIIIIDWPIGQKSLVFTNGLEDWGSIPGWVIPKTQKMVLDAALLNTQHYKVRIKGKVEQSREWSRALPYTSV